ncbi:polysaccharide biosynthesis protein [Thermococcus sp. EP1]|uniref:flippase n=1 Tax=Thermococcus sp. EP1 TaxID=1591054 RepID=UPI0006DAB4DF|nr:flippase [Thermococcus sp. EP1]KPU63861.1 polysaccharide biosynthesis protein [Thermococcus sp. EP1]
MSDASQALQKIAKGTGIVFVGTVISMLFQFLSRAIIARYFSTAEYGVFNLALTVLSITLVIVMLGFQNSLPREIAFYNEKEPSKVPDLISVALIIVVVNSILWMVILILGAGGIAQIFNERELSYVLKIIAFALPFSALTGTITSISRGFGRVRERVYFKNIVYPTTFLVLVLFGTFLDFSFAFVFFAYVIAQAFTLVALVIDVWRMCLFKFDVSFDLKLGKEVVSFSLPLMITGILGFLMTWTDTLMLGYYLGSEIVGVYNSASPIARLLPIFLKSVVVLYPPIATSLYAQGKVGELRRTYQILTKWVFLLTLPLFVLIFVFPEAMIKFFFGANYLEASKTLQILALGFMVHAFLGLNWGSLIVIGESNLNLIGDFFAAVLNVILNAILIPFYGLEGAAFATTFSYFVANVFRSYWLYKKTKIHPFSRNYVKSLVISFVMLGLLKVFCLAVSNIWHAILLLLVFLSLYFLLILLSRSIDREDVELLLAIEKKWGVDFRVIKKVLKKFV